MTKCISQLVFSRMSTQQLRGDEGEGGQEVGDDKGGGALLEAVRGADKKISFVILSGGTKGKKERVSDSKRLLPPCNQRRKETRWSCIYNFPFFFFSSFPLVLSADESKSIRGTGGMACVG